MKTRSLSILLLVLLLCLLCSCSAENNQPENSEPETEFSTESTETPKEIESHNIDDSTQLTINTDILNDVGSTFSELTDKYGELTHTGRIHGGLDYTFENAQDKCFLFYLDDVIKEDASGEPYKPLYESEAPHLQYDGYFHDEKGNFIPLPKDDAKCLGIENINAKKIFIDAPDMITIYDIQRIEGIEDFHIYPSDRYDNYLTQFVYQGVQITLCHENIELIDLSLYNDHETEFKYKEYTNGCAVLRLPRT